MENQNYNPNTAPEPQPVPPQAEPQTIPPQAEPQTIPPQYVPPQVPPYEGVPQQPVTQQPGYSYPPVQPVYPQEPVPPQAIPCVKCGTPVPYGMQFCPACGTNQAAKPKEPITKKPLFWILGGVGVLALIAAVVLVLVLVLRGVGGKSGSNFNKMFSSISGKEWVTIAGDGSWMEVDTNPNNLDDDNSSYKIWCIANLSSAMDTIKDVNEKLGFNDALYKKMVSTTALQGRQSEENDKYRVTWTYHPDKGLEALYEKKSKK